MSAVELWTGDAARWDAFVAAQPDGTACHLAGWREVMTDVLGHECRYLVARDAAGDWAGVLPLVRVRGGVFGDYLLSMPFLNAGGPLGAAPAAAALAERAVTMARADGVDLLELRTRADAALPLGVSHRKVRVVLPLAATAGAVWARFPAKLRSQVRRPLKEGFESRFGGDQIAAFYDVFARTMRRLGTPVLPRAFFERAARALGDVIDFGVVYRGTRPVAAGAGLIWGGEFEMTWAGSLREEARAAPNMLLYWAFMERAVARGLARFDFGRSTPGGGTHRFKQQWGGADEPLPWRQWSRGAVAATPSPDRPAFRVATAVWSRIPLSITNRLGPVLARRLP